MKKALLLFLLLFIPLVGETHLILDVEGGSLTEREETKGVALLSAWSLLLSEQETLLSLHQDIYPKSIVELTPIATRFHFYLPDDLEILDGELFDFARELPQKIPTPEAISMARSLLKEDEPSAERVTAQSVLTHLQETFQKAHAELITSKGGCDEVRIVINSGDESSFTLAKELTLPDESGDEFILDGKITMKRPGWWQTRWWGRWLGVSLFLMAAGSVALGALVTIVAPYAAVACLLTMGSSTYYVVINPYLYDPHVVMEKRREDLEHGFKYAYLHGRAAYTLTPHERRTLFIKEICQGTHEQREKPSDFPINMLTDQIHLTDPIFTTLLYPCELKSLLNLRDQFIQARSQFWKERILIEEELARLLAPHEVIRDLRFDSARKCHEANPTVIRQRALQAERAKEIDEVWKKWRAGMISAIQRDASIEQIDTHYATLMGNPEDQLELKRAWEELEAELQAILAQFKLAEENCKNMMHYNERMKNLEGGKWGLYQRYSDWAVSLVRQFPENDSIVFPDSLDLRKKK